MRVTAVIAFLMTFISALPARADCVVLLHGLARSASSMWVMEEALEAEGYKVINLGYPSTKAEIPVLANTAIPLRLRRVGTSGCILSPTRWAAS